MSLASVIGIALVVGAVAVLGIAIVSYMSSLVQSAYEIKVEIRSDLDNGLKQMKADNIKEMKSARAELVSESEKTRNNILDDLKKRQETKDKEIIAEFKKRDDAWAAENQQLTAHITELTERIELLEKWHKRAATNTMKSATEESPETQEIEETPKEDSEPISNDSKNMNETDKAPLQAASAQALSLKTFSMER